MERLQAVNKCHYFVACLPDRPKENCAIDFSAEEALDYVPVMRTRSGVSGNEVVLPHGRMPLSAVQLPFVPRFDRLPGAWLGMARPRSRWPTLRPSHATYFRISGVSICWRWP